MGQLTIVNKEVRVKEYGGQRVVTLKDVDAVHERPDGRKRFNDKRKRFVEGKDYLIEGFQDDRSVMDFAASLDGTVGIDYNGFIYLVPDRDGNIKIGRTKHRTQRVSTLNTGRVDALTEFEWFPCKDVLKAEKAIHAELSAYRVKNEWFNCPKKFAAEIISRVTKDVDDGFDPYARYRGGLYGSRIYMTSGGSTNDTECADSESDDVVFIRCLNMAKTFAKSTGVDIKRAIMVGLEEAERLTGADYTAWKKLLPMRTDTRPIPSATEVGKLVGLGEQAVNKKLDVRQEVTYSGIC